MEHSGKKLVSFLVGLALLAGVASWWYRYESAHRASAYWGETWAPLIAEPSEVEMFRLLAHPAEESMGDAHELSVAGRRYWAVHPTRLTHVRGMVHLRHALLSDGSYRWGERVDPTEVDWGWCLRFTGLGRELWVLMARDFSVTGSTEERGRAVSDFLSCEPMSESLRSYFQDVVVLDASSEP